MEEGEGSEDPLEEALGLVSLSGELRSSDDALSETDLDLEAEVESDFLLLESLVEEFVEVFRFCFSAGPVGSMDRVGFVKVLTVLFRSVPRVFRADFFPVFAAEIAVGTRRGLTLPLRPMT